MRNNHIKRACISIEELDKNPFVQFHKWFGDACKIGIEKPNAAFLSTVTKNLVPDSRTVMIKAYDEKGFVFFTDCRSNKVAQIANNGNVALLFSWLETERQVKVSGVAHKLSVSESFLYFSKRGSNMGCWIEDNGFVSVRMLLEKQFGSILKALYEKGIESSDIFCGYRIVPDFIAFWQVCKDKLYQQFSYCKTKNGWKITED